MDTSPRAARLFRHWRLTVDQYSRMIGAGILSEDDPVFLWKGLLLEKTKRERPHVVASLKLDRALARPASVHSSYVEQRAATRLFTG